MTAEPGPVLVTGCNGFVGRHLCQRLKDRGSIVFGVDVHPEPWAKWLGYASINITDSTNINNFIKERLIRQVYHLAAIASPWACTVNPEKAVEVNVRGVLSLYEACRVDPKITVLVVGSSEEYQHKPGEDIVYCEEDALDSHNVYGATKISAEVLGKAFTSQYRSRIFFTRSFNHTGPGQSPIYVLADFAKQCVEIANNLRTPLIETGNIEVARDFLDVRDVIEAYLAIMDLGQPGESYNVCSGKAYRIKDILNLMLVEAGCPDARVVVNPDRVRAYDPKSVRGSHAKLTVHTGWEPRISIGQTVRDLVKYWSSIYPPVVLQ